MPLPVAEFNNVSKSFGTTTALQGVTLDVAAGEIIAIVGHNGSGKSTFLKIASGFLTPDSGTVTINGQGVAFESRPARPGRNVGVILVPQSPPLFPDLTVIENLYAGHEPRKRVFGLDFLDRGDMERKAASLLSEVGLASVDLQMPASKLSGGEQLLVAFLRLARGPANLFALDEPTAALGPEERHSVNLRIRGLAASGAGVLMVTHILRDAIEIAQRVAVFANGRISHLLNAAALSEEDLVSAISCE